MEHNEIKCAHCGNRFDFSENKEFLVNGKTFKGLCSKCREVHAFAVHILDDVMQVDGTLGESIMVDIHPLRPPVQAPRRPVERSELGEHILSQSVVGKSEASEKELEQVSDQTMKDLDEMFGKPTAIDFEEE